jgi:hypothetical protein
VRTDLADLVADPEPQRALEHIPGPIVDVMDLQRRDPLVCRLASIRPLDTKSLSCPPSWPPTSDSQKTPVGNTRPILPGRRPRRKDS